jgi:DNA invertase Pin-like site-specific DNA recombinase
VGSKATLGGLQGLQAAAAKGTYKGSKPPPPKVPTRATDRRRQRYLQGLQAAAAKGTFKGYKPPPPKVPHRSFLAPSSIARRLPFQ